MLQESLRDADARQDLPCHHLLHSYPHKLLILLVPEHVLQLDDLKKLGLLTDQLIKVFGSGFRANSEVAQVELLEGFLGAFAKRSEEHRKGSLT